MDKIIAPGENYCKSSQTNAAASLRVLRVTHGNWNANFYERSSAQFCHSRHRRYYLLSKNCTVFPGISASLRLLWGQHWTNSKQPPLRKPFCRVLRVIITRHDKSGNSMRTKQRDLRSGRVGHNSTSQNLISKNRIWLQSVKCHVKQSINIHDFKFV